MKIAIVGAGITGCLLANALDSENLDVSIFEKSRGCGGRASTKQTDFGQCDIGATIVPALKVEFANFMQQLCNQNLASKWPQNVYVADQIKGNKHALERFISDREYYVFNEKMNAACRHWARNSHLHTNSLISQIRYCVGKGWQLKLNDAWQTEWFDKVVVTAPWPQSQAIIEQSELSLRLPNFSQSWTSCWSIAVKLERLVATDVDLIYLKNHPIQTLVRDSGKPQRPLVVTSQTDQKSEIWIAQLSNKLSDSLGSQERDQAISIATKGLCEFFDLPDKAVSNTYGHYWRYARPSAGQKPLGILSNHELGVYVGGDWSFGASIESAYEGSLALSQLIKTGV
ncbi:NAD(P)-binding protein [uncultured Paraglaciecola sp.]|uniref:NAD(P)/FAD-dependent oxidoreductase n=1 Tax=uncultured Paraglaciecola sp. TaxID=1765024 RepID=UPI0030DA40C5|tara:strand:- start:80590 stop:81615 length:1026 start_codon:yes stop_codon:yes gene_type:complete